MQNNLHKHKGFKLLSLEVIGHKILGTNKFNFVDFLDEPDSIYTTVIIGPNGTGKSELLSVILDIFRNICSLDLKDKFSDITGRYNLKYKNENSIYEVTNISDGLHLNSLTSRNPVYSKPTFLKDSKEINFKNAIKTIPKAIVANSILLTDKFIVPRNDKEQEQFPMYRYLGVRNSPQQASTRSYVRKTVEFVVEQIESQVFKDGLEKITDYLGLSKSINIIFYTSNTAKFFNGNLKKKELDSYFGEIKKNYANKEQSAPFKLNNYEVIVKKDSKYIEELCEFINSLVWDKRFYPHYNDIYRRSSIKLLSYDITDEFSHNKLRSEYIHLDVMRKIGLLQAPEIKFGQKLSDEIESHKPGYFTFHNNIYLQNTSSGEFHFFSTMVGLMATIKPNSLILIDEPEISLHPNWQMQYLHFLRQLFSDEVYQSCHIIITTHSHFLVSDLRGPSSKIIGLSKQEGKINTRDIKNNTFGWSAEEVLLEIFQVPTTRNYYVADKVGLILDEIAKPKKNTELIRKYIQELKENNIDKLSKEDPLKEIIDTLIKKYD
ncbi:AAA family ATPase [Vitellibacter sp. q18]|nr:AAA family ATPase [Aequorivita lutea]